MAGSTTNKKSNDVCNFNAVRPALEKLHNAGNKKALTKDDCFLLGISEADFDKWEKDVLMLQAEVERYVDLAINGKNHSEITASQIKEARDKIFPRWKLVISHGEAKKHKRAIHTSEFDVEALIKFAWNFGNANAKSGEGFGTYMYHVKSKDFRLYVEKYLGCLMAQQDILNDEERDILQTYTKNASRIESATSKIEDTNAEIKSYEQMKKDIPESEVTFVAYIEKQIAEKKSAISDLESAIAEATEACAKYEESVKAIRARIKFTA